MVSIFGSVSNASRVYLRVCTKRISKYYGKSTSCVRLLSVVHVVNYKHYLSVAIFLRVGDFF